MIEPIWLGEPEVLAIHELQLAEHGGAAGIRDVTMLKSGLARAHQKYAYGTPDLFELAATYAAAIIRNHPFIDGNKRTGFVLAVLFLELNGVTFDAPEAEATQAVEKMCADSVYKTPTRTLLKRMSAGVKAR